MGEKQRYCRKCLLRDMDEKEMFKNLYDYIERLPEEDKVTADLYETRLEACKTCGKLINGMCRICGCYVELRAVMKVKSCPDFEPKWTAWSDEEDVL